MSSRYRQLCLQGSLNETFRRSTLLRSIVFSAYPTPTTVQRVARQTLGSEVVNNDISKLRAFFWRAQPTASSLAAFSHGYTKPGEDDDEGTTCSSRHLYKN